MVNVRGIIPFDHFYQVKLWKTHYKTMGMASIANYSSHYQRVYPLISRHYPIIIPIKPYSTNIGIGSSQVFSLAFNCQRWEGSRCHTSQVNNPYRRTREFSIASIFFTGGFTEIIWQCSKTGWWFGTCLFSHIFGMSSSQMTFKFFRGVGSTTNQIMTALCSWFFKASLKSGMGLFSSILGNAS